MRETFGIYIHIPFCIKKCGYCDFNSYGSMEEVYDEYVVALKKEISLISFQSSAFSLQPYEIISIFFGGGTPTIIDSKQLIEILGMCKSLFNLRADAEITIESNPETLNTDKLRDLIKGGFNRISIGVQSFNNRLLKKLGRAHDSKKAYSQILSARDAGFENISIDLMFGVPDETPDDWKSDIETAIKLKPEHISTYNLTVEKGTEYEREFLSQRLKLPEEDKQLEMYEMGIELLTKAGYKHYEISNFAKADRKCLHNQIYWKNEEYLGIGAGAYSYIDGERRWNVKNPVEYIKAIMLPPTPPTYKGGDKERVTVEGRERLEGKDVMGETIMMGLRMIEGINLKSFKRRFGVELKSIYSDTISQLLKDNLVVFDNGNLKLTHKGLLFYNDVSAEFLS